MAWAEVRFVAADDIWLSPAYGRASAFITLLLYDRTDDDFERYCRALEAIALACGGRPHWAKPYFADPAVIRNHYLRFADWSAVRNMHDPDGIFLGPFLRRLLA